MVEDDVERVLTVAKSAFTQAIDHSACMTILSVPNNEETFGRLKEAGVHRTTEVIKLALFQRLLIGTTMAFAPIRDGGDYHIRVAIEAMRGNDDVFRRLCERGDKERLQAAIDEFLRTENSDGLKHLVHIRNKEAAHFSALKPDIPRATVQELLDLTMATNRTSENLANGAGAVRLSLASQVEAHINSAKAFWAPWMDHGKRN